MRNRPFIGLLLVLVISGTVGLRAQNTREQESRKAKLEKEIAQIDKRLAETRSKSSSALSSLSLVQKKVDSRKALIAESDREIQAVTARIKAKQQEIDVIQRRLDTLSLYYSRLVQNAYKNREAINTAWTETVTTK